MRSDRKNVTAGRALPTGFVGLAIVAAFVLMALDRDGELRQDEAHASVHRPVVEAALERIAAESAGAVRDPAVEGEADRYNVLAPSFGAPNFGAPAGFAVSPDDRYVYLSTPQHGILIIGRATPPTADKDDGSDTEAGS